MNLHVISLGRYGEPVCRGTGKGGLCGSLLQGGEHGAAGFHWRGDGAGWRAWAGRTWGMQMGNPVPRTDGREMYVAREMGHFALRSK